MSKELRNLLDKLNSVRNECLALVNDNKLEEAEQKRLELKDLQNKFDIMKDLEEQEIEVIENKFDNEELTVLNENKKEDEKTLFVKTVKAMVNNKKMTQKEADFVNIMMEKNVDGEGLTVPDDMRTQIIELRSNNLQALENYVNIEPVTTNKGSRVIEANAMFAPFVDIEEGEQFPYAEDPEFKKVSYQIVKRGGLIDITRELLQDSDANFETYIRNWMAKKGIATRNALIVNTLRTKYTNKVDIKALDDLKDLVNVQLDPAYELGAAVYTNQDGFNFLDKMKDIDGKYVIQPDVTQPTKMLLFGKYPIVKFSNKVLQSVAGKAPVIVGDLESAITLFDRELMTIEASDFYKWDKDIRTIKGRERLDAQIVLEDAVAFGEITVSTEAPATLKRNRAEKEDK